MSRLSSQIIFGDLTGGINNVDTKETINASPKKTQSPDMVNVEYFGLGGIKSMEGNTVVGKMTVDDEEVENRFNDKVIGGWEYVKAGVRYMIVGLGNGEVYRYNPNTNHFDLIYTFANDSDRMSFCNMNNGVVITNGIDDLVFYEINRHQALSGTVTVDNGSDEVNGTSTDFDTELHVGDYVEIDGCKGRYRVETITNGTKMTVSPAIDTSYDTIYYQFYDANNHVSIYSTVEIPQIGDTLYSIDTNTDPYTITIAGTVAIEFDPEANNMAYHDTNNVLQSARRPAIHTDITVTTTPATLTDVNIYLGEISECNATLVNEDDPNLATPIRGLAIQYYAGRLWVGGDNGLFWSQLGQYDKWDIKYDAGVLYSIYNDSSPIKALGLFSEFLVIHKAFSTYILTLSGIANGTESDISTMSVKPFSNITCESQQSWIVSNTKYYVYSRDFMDIYPLVQHTIFNDKFLGEPVTQKVRNIFKNLIPEDAGNIFCVGRSKERQMIFYLPLVNRLGSAYGLIFDFQTKSWLLRCVPQNVTIAFNYNNNIYIGTNDGLVLREFSGSSFRIYDSIKNEMKDEPIVSYYKSPWFDWAGGYTQSFAEFIIEIDNSSENSFYIRTQKDGQSRYEDRLIDSYKLNGKALIWDGPETQDMPDNLTLWDDDIWVKGTFENIRMLLPNNVFEDFQIEIGTNQSGQAFSIYQYGFRRIETEEAPW